MQLSPDVVTLVVLLIAVCMIAGSFPLLMHHVISVWRELLR